MIGMTSDWHADEGAWAKYPELSGDAEYSLTQIVSFLIDHKATALLAAGDLYNSSDPTTTAQHFVHRQLDRCEDAGLPVYFVQGQHERSLKVPRLSAHRWPIHLHEQTVEIEGRKVYGLDWQSRSRLPDALARVPADTDLLMCHQAWNEQMQQIVGVRECDGSTLLIPHVREVLSGDLHQHKITEFVNAQGQTGMFISPGSISMRSKNEEEDKYFFTWERVGDDFELSSQALETRRVLRFRISTDDELRQLEHEAQTTDLFGLTSTRLPPRIARPLCLIEYSTLIPDVYIRLQTVCRGRAFLFPEPMPLPGAPTRVIDASRRSVVPLGMLGALGKLTSPDGEIYNGLRRLLEANDLNGELQALRAEFFPPETVTP